MPKVIIDMTMSLDGFVSGPLDGPEFPLGKHGGPSLFDWYFSGTEEYREPQFRPEPGANLDEVKRMFEESGAYIFGRRTYDINRGRHKSGKGGGGWKARCDPPPVPRGAMRGRQLGLTAG